MGGRGAEVQAQLSAALARAEAAEAKYADLQRVHVGRLLSFDAECVRLIKQRDAAEAKIAAVRKLQRYEPTMEGRHLTVCESPEGRYVSYWDLDRALAGTDARGGE
jgi:hypothetical protein